VRCLASSALNWRAPDSTTTIPSANRIARLILASCSFVISFAVSSLRPLALDLAPHVVVPREYDDGATGDEQGQREEDDAYAGSGF